MLRPIFYTFCNLTEDKEDSSRRVRAWNEQVLEDRTVDEWNWEWIDKTFSFFSFARKKTEQVRNASCKYIAITFRVRKTLGNDVEDERVLERKYDVYTYIQIYFILYTICSRFIKYFLRQIFLYLSKE